MGFSFWALMGFSGPCGLFGVLDGLGFSSAALAGSCKALGRASFGCLPEGFQRRLLTTLLYLVLGRMLVFCEPPPHKAG